jgi:ABC-2 type transport system permease protein
MSNVYFIAMRELRSIFTSPIGWIVLTLFLLLNGWIFFGLLNRFNFMSFLYMQMQNPQMLMQMNLNQQVMAPILQNMTIILLLVVPLVTMRLFAEERKLKTDELLFTSPVSVGEIVMGKFVAAFVFLSVMLALTFIYPGILFKYGNPEMGPLVSGYLGLLLLATCFVAVGLFTSSLTENQIVAAVSCFVVLLMFYLININSMTMSGATKDVLDYLSLIGHFEPFIKGVIDSKGLVYYVTFTIAGLILTGVSLESRRWR